MFDIFSTCFHCSLHTQNFNKSVDILQLKPLLRCVRVACDSLLTTSLLHSVNRQIVKTCYPQTCWKLLQQVCNLTSYNKPAKLTVCNKSVAFFVAVNVWAFTVNLFCDTHLQKLLQIELYRVLDLCRSGLQFTHAAREQLVCSLDNYFESLHCQVGHSSDSQTEEQRDSENCREHSQKSAQENACTSGQSCQSECRQYTNWDPHWSKEEGCKPNDHFEKLPFLNFVHRAGQLALKKTSSLRITLIKTFLRLKSITKVG